MNPEDVKQLLKTVFTDADIIVLGEGRNFDIKVVSAAFEGLRPVQRQQKVYAALNDKIAAGDIHAVNMVTVTPQEVTPQEQ